MTTPTTAKRRSPGEGGAFEYKTAAGPRWYWKAQITGPDGVTKPVARRRGLDGEPFTTKKAALAAMREAMSRSDKKQWTDPSKEPVGDFLATWLDGLRLEPSTMASYRKNVRLHITPAIGLIPLASLTTTRIDALYRQLEKSGRKDYRAGEGLSPRTVRYIHMILCSALDDAKLTRNPAATAHPPTAKQSKSPEMHPWTAEQLAAFLGWSAEHSTLHHFAWWLLAHTGMRRGELLALRWRDFDFDAGTVSIRRSVGVVRVKGQGAKVVTGPTKGGTSRVVSIDPATVTLGRAHRKERAALSLSLITPDALVFADEEGRGLHPERFSRKFQSELKKARRVLPDLPEARLHDLRHTHLTILLTKGTPVKQVSARAGHKSAVVTMTVYAHVMPGDDASAAAMFADVITKAG
jgi:integrase